MFQNIKFFIVAQIVCHLWADNFCSFTNQKKDEKKNTNQKKDEDQQTLHFLLFFVLFGSKVFSAQYQYFG